MKYIDNRINANIVKLEDENNNYMSEDVEGALEEIDSKIKTIEANGYDDTKIKQEINNIKNEIGTEELTTTDQTIKGAVNEVNTRINTIEGNAYDDTQIKQHINNVKTEIGTEELTTNSKNIKGSVNELNSQIKDIKKIITPSMNEVEIKNILNNYSNVLWKKGEYNLQNIYFNSNQYIYFEEGVLLNTLELTENNGFIVISDVENLRINGEIKVKFNRVYTNEELKPCVSISGSKNINIDTITSYNSGGDAVLLHGGDDFSKHNENINIKNIYSYDSNRTGLCIVDVNYLNVENIFVFNTNNRLSYTSGLHLEPYDKNVFDNINICNVYINGNATSYINYGIILNLQQIINKNEISLTLENLHVRYSNVPIEISHLQVQNTSKNGELNGVISIKNIKSDFSKNGISLLNLTKERSPVVILDNIYMSNCNIDNGVADSQSCIRILYNNNDAKDYTLGNIIIKKLIANSNSSIYKVISISNTINDKNDISIESVTVLNEMKKETSRVSCCPIQYNGVLKGNFSNMPVTIYNSQGLNIDSGSFRGWGTEYNNEGATSDMHFWLQFKHIGTKLKIKVKSPYYIKISPNSNGETLLPDYVYPTKLIKSNTVGSYIVIEKISDTLYDIIEKVGVWEDQ